MEALQYLRKDITPSHTKDPSELHQLASHLLCKSGPELKESAQWEGSDPEARQSVLSQVQSYIPPHIILPPQRLNRVQELQRRTESSVLTEGLLKFSRRPEQWEKRRSLICRLPHLSKLPVVPRPRMEFAFHQVYPWSRSNALKGTRILIYTRT